MQFNRRSFLKGAATAASASAFLSSGAGAKPVPAKLDDRLELDGGLEEVVITFQTNDDVTDLDRFDLAEGYYQFEVLPFGYTKATDEQIQRIAQLQSVRRITPNYELEYFNDDARKETGAEAVAESLGYDGTHGHVAVVDTGIGAPHPDHRINVVNNSFGPINGNGADWDPDDPTNVATFELYQAGILPVFAAGNCGPQGSADCTRTGNNTQSNPSQAPWNLSVAATNDDREVTGFSSRGRTEDYDGIANDDRQEALANYAEYRRSLQPPGDEDDTEEFYDVADSGTAPPFVIVTADSFTLQADPETSLEEVDGYWASSTLTWDPSTGRGSPEPSEFEFRLEDSDGNVVTSDGSTFVDRVRNEARLTVQSYLPLPDGEETYSLVLTSSRTGGQYEVSGEVLAVDAEDGIPNPERPYALYRPSIGAPGDSIWSTVTPEDQLAVASAGNGEQWYATLSGTSMATPVVAGIVALLNDAYYEEYGEYPDVLEVIDVLETTAEFQPEEKNHTVHNIGKGFVNAEAALEELLARGAEEEDTEDESGWPGDGVDPRNKQDRADL